MSPARYRAAAPVEDESLEARNKLIAFNCREGTTLIASI